MKVMTWALPESPASAEAMASVRCASFLAFSSRNNFFPGGSGPIKHNRASLSGVCFFEIAIVHICADNNSIGSMH